MDTAALQRRIKAFVSQRQWEQYHTPKNVAIALSVEVSELLEHFQWMSDRESREIPAGTARYERIREEFADSMIYLLRFAELMDIDIEQAVSDKIDANERKYPVELSKGTFVKYSDREDS